MANSDLRWYILVVNYEQGFALRDLLLKHDIKNRIAPAPRSIQGELSCGMSLLIEDEDIEAALYALERCGIHYHLTAIPGLGGKEMSQEHAIKTAALISRHRPLSIWCIMLKIWPNTPLAQMVEDGIFEPMTPEEILQEELEMVSRITLPGPTLYVDSTVLQKYSIVAMLPEQKDSMLQQMQMLLNTESQLS